MSPAASLNDDFLFRSLMETMADSIYFKDRQGRLLRVSWKMARDLGYADPAELVGKTDVDLFGQEFAERTMLLIRAERFATCFAVLFIDLDGFKRINDSRGHDVGDLVLRAVAERLSQSVRAADTVARIGGDEFVILLEALRAGGDATAVAQKIHGALEKPFALPGGAAKVTVSIGIGLYPQDGRDADVLLKAADIDMYRAKQKTAAPRPVGPNGEPDTRSE